MTMRLTMAGLIAAALLAGAEAASGARGHLDTEGLPAYLRDRGEGVPLSQFGTYIRKGQIFIYPYFEYYRDGDFEYAPNELGFSGDSDYRGDYEASEWLLFFGYGISDRLALEIEAAGISAELEKSAADPSGLPDAISESGIGDVESQLRWRWSAETERRPEVFSTFEVVFPTQDKGSLIGTTDWEFQFGTGVVRGYGWGTLTGRVAVEYEVAEGAFDLGEAAVEYLRRLSPRWRIFAAVEGTQDEVELITEAQWHPRGDVIVKLNNAFGVTSKAPDWAPEIGIMFAFR